jgi:hypothetical protein
VQYVQFDAVFCGSGNFDKEQTSENSTHAHEKNTLIFLITRASLFQLALHF